MKKIIILFIAILFILTSCQEQSEIMTEREQEVASRTIAGVLGIGDGMFIEFSFNIHDINAVTNSVSQIVLCRIENLEKVTLGYELAQLSFQYNVIIDDIYMDDNNTLNIEDRITVTSMKGIITGNEYKKVAEKAFLRHRAFGHVIDYTSRDYEENEYILSTMFDSIPFEVGKTYIMYLNEYDVEKNHYVESGFEFAYEYNETDGILYYGIDYKRMDIGIDELKQQILNDISGGDVIEKK